MKERCKWVNTDNPLYVEYHDVEWSVPKHNDKELFELLILEGFQAGLSWECVLNKRQDFRRAYDNFDVHKVSRYGQDKINELMADCKIIRNRRKIEASIENASVFMEIQREFGSFDKYIWSFTNGEVIFEDYSLYTFTPLSLKISKDLKKRGMKFVGETIIYSYLQAIGVIYAHGKECSMCKG